MPAPTPPADGATHWESDWLIPILNNLTDNKEPAGLSTTTKAALSGTYAPLVAPTTTQTGTAYTLTLGDANSVVESNSASAATFTVPPNSAMAFSVGTTVIVRQYGAGQVTVAAGSGVTIRSRGGALKTAGQYAEASLTKRAADEWVLSGDVTS